MLGLIGAAAAGPSAATRADIFLLHNGGELRGRWVNREEPSATAYEIETAGGGKLTLDRSQVRQAIPQSQQELAYEQLATRSSGSIADQWKLAEWCREQQMPGPRQTHLEFILSLDPDHAEARHALGYSQVRGQWTRRSDFQKQQGYELVDGRWRLPQEVALRKNSAEVEKKQKDWQTKLVRWREMLATDKAASAEKQIAAIRDPYAVPALREVLSNERLREVKLLLIEVLAQIGNDAAIQTLIDATMHDPDIEVFHACLDRIAKHNRAGTVEQYVKMLKDANNVRLNRAAYALGRLDDDSVLSPLIDTLVTTHTIVIPGGSADTYTAGFSNAPVQSGPCFGAPGASPFPGGAQPTGGNTFVAGDQTKKIPVTVANQEVLSALVKLSDGANFGFDTKAWRYWLAAENRRNSPTLSSRRDAD